jgi:hypothetical protein
MSFKRRNTLVLLIQILLVCGAGGYITLKHIPQRMAEIRKEIELCDHTFAQYPERETYLSDVNLKIEETKSKLMTWNKVIDNHQTLADVLAYLDKIQEQFGALKFNLTYVRDVQASGYGYKVFTFNGEGPWQSIFALIWVLERGPKMFIIERFSLRGVEGVSDDEDLPYTNNCRVIVPFSLQVRAVYADCGEVKDLPINSSADFLIQIPEGNNLFMPLITRDLPPNRLGLLETERAELRAIFPDKAIVADHSGKIHSLEEGDEVYLGYLTKIDQEKNCVEFLLNKGGIVEKFVMKMSFSQTGEKTNG